VYCLTADKVGNGHLMIHHDESSVMKETVLPTLSNGGLSSGNGISIGIAVPSFPSRTTRCGNCSHTAETKRCDMLTMFY
jgi:hypothetical protein